MKQFLTITCLVSLLFNGSVYTQQSNCIDSLEVYIQNALELFEVPGVAIGIIKDGEVVLNRGFGFANAETKKPVDSQTIFGIASCTKAFTAAALAIAVDDSLLAWNDKVVTHYPEFQLSDPFISKDLQVMDLLCHRSGLQTFDGDLLWYGTDYSRDEVVKRIRNRELTYPIRSQFGYQNVMYITAGQVLQQVSGKTWDDFLTDYIFNPLRMNSTSTTNGHFSPDMNIAYPHIDGKALEFLDYDNSGPAASINTCSDDLLKWLSMWLNKDDEGNHQIFSEEQYQKLLTPQTILNSGHSHSIGGTHFYTYGLGWFMLDYQGRKVIQHGGGLPGFHSKVVLVPEDKLGYIIIANQLSGLVESLYKKILDFYTSDAQTDWAQIYRQSELKRKAKVIEKEAKQEEARRTDTNPSLDLVNYTGTFIDDMYGQAEISLNNDTLNLILLPSKDLFTSKMEHWEDDTFKITFNDPFLPRGFVSFELDEDQKVKYFTIELKNPDFHFYKLLFEKND